MNGMMVIFRVCGGTCQAVHCITAGAVDTAQSSLLEGKTVLLTGRSVSKEIQISFF